MALPHHVRHRLLRRGVPLAAEVPARTEGHCAWVSVHPVLGRLAESYGTRDHFVVRYFEMPAARVEELRRSSHEPKDEEFINAEELSVGTEEELARALARWLDDPNRLVQEGLAGIP